MSVRLQHRDARPWQVTVSVVLFAAWWLSSAGSLIVLAAGDGGTGGFAGAVAGMTFWTAIAGWLLIRAWRGGPVARVVLWRLGTGLGALGAFGLLATYAFLGRSGGIDWSPALLTGPLSVVALFTAGALLGTARARAWRPGR